MNLSHVITEFSFGPHFPDITVAALLERPLRAVLEYSMPELVDESMNRRMLLSIPSCVVRDGYV